MQVVDEVVVVVVLLVARVVDVVVVLRVVVLDVGVLEVVVLVPPLHAVPLSAKFVGAGFVVPFDVPWNPKLVLAPVLMEPFQLAFFAVTAVPLWVTVAFHAEVTVWPPVNDQVNVQLDSASPVFVTVTFATKPPDHCEVTE